MEIQDGNKAIIIHDEYAILRKDKYTGRHKQSKLSSKKVKATDDYTNATLLKRMNNPLNICNRHA